MEKLLARIARQLDSLDEASLMDLWSKYATATSHFEPTREWEEAALIFSLIQAKRWKNQLFNSNWARVCQPNGDAPMPLLPTFSLEVQGGGPGPEPRPKAPRPCRVLRFQPSKNAETASKTEPKSGK